MSESKYPHWVDDFLSAFGGQYDTLNQKDFVEQQNQNKDRQNMNSMNEFTRTNPDDAAVENGINDQTGNKFEVVVKKDRDDKAIKNKSLQVQFSSGENKELYTCSSIDDFCNGKYANLKNEPLGKIAKAIAEDNKFVVSFIETSVAANIEQMEIEQAIKLANAVTKEKTILESDYYKLCSKLDSDNIKIFANFLGACGISVVSNRGNAKQDVSYYMNFIKDFKEYKVAKQTKNSRDINSLKDRIASIKIFEKVQAELNEEFKKDEILKLIIGE